MLALAVVAAIGALRPPLHTRRDVAIGSTAAAAASIITPSSAASTFATSASVTLADGAVFPLASFGLQIYDDAMAEQLTLLALDAGFRNFFCKQPNRLN